MFADDHRSASGGSVAINGFLYQILANLSRAAEFLLEARLSGGDVRSAILILEPWLGGGDARYERGLFRLAEQYKTRRSNKQWTLSQIIGGVLPDLLKAVPDSDPHPSTYRFVTDGLICDLTEFEGFCSRVPSHLQDADELLSALDDTSTRRFSPRGVNLTDRQMFRRIASAAQVRDLEAIEQETTLLRVGRLLAGFEVAGQLLATQFEAQVDSLLVGLVDNPDPEAVAGKRLELCGHLLRQLARGEVRTTPEALLAAVGIKGKDMKARQDLVRTVREITADRLARDGYDPGKDVRESPCWPEAKPVLLIAGDSGCGKSWQLGKLALSLLDEDHPTTYGHATSDVTFDVESLVNTIWQTALNHTTRISLEGFAAACKTIWTAHKPPYATLCLDDVRTVEQARQLLSLDWSYHGIRLVLGLSSGLARTVTAQWQETVSTVTVSDFTTAELRKFLSLSGRHWDDLPTDVRRILRRPILARLYCELGPTHGWSPRNEYELFERYWARLSNASQYDHPHDLAKLRDLVATILAENAVYPWSSEILSKCGIDEDSVRRLEGVGWIRRDDSQSFSVPHERLLNWAVAQSLVGSLTSHAITKEAAQELLLRCLDDRPQAGRPFLGYVPMDFLWLATSPGIHLDNDVPAFIDTMEQATTFHNHPERLYKHLLPTLGERIVPALLGRLTELRSRGTTADYVSPLVGDALVAIGGDSPDFVRSAAAPLLEAKDHLLVNVALRVFTRLPDTAVLDQIWAVHLARKASQAANAGMESAFDSELSFRCMVACLEGDVTWLRRQIMLAEPGQEHVSQLAYLVATLRGPKADSFWREMKTELISKVNPVHAAPLVRCIHRYLDRGETGRLSHWLTRGDDFVPGWAFVALCDLDPDAALAQITTVEESLLSFVRQHWLPSLGRHRPDVLRHRLLQIAETSGSSYRFLTDLLDGSEEIVDLAILNRIIVGVTMDMKSGSPKGEYWLDGHLRFLHNLVDPDLVSRIRSLAGSEFETLLTEAAKARVGRSPGMRDPILDQARRVLLRIGGRGLTELVNFELAHGDHWARCGGLEWASVNPDDETRTLLKSLAMKDPRTDEGKREHYPALQALAALHEDESLVSAILIHGTKVPYDLPYLRSDGDPMTTETLEEPLRLLREGDEKEVEGALVALYCSPNRECIPEIRAFIASGRGSEEARFQAARALYFLGDRGDEFVAAAASLLKARVGTHFALQMLFGVGTDQALRAVESHLEGTPLDKFGDEEWGAFFSLWRIPESRPFVVARMPELTLKAVLPRARGRYLEIAAEIGGAEAEELLFETAYESPIPGQVLGAIRGLVRFNLDAAFQAAVLAIPHHDSIADELARLMLTLDEPRAVRSLCDLAVSEDRTNITWTVGRALRRAGSRTAVETALTGMLSSSATPQRLAASELAGWLPDDMLAGLLQDMANGDQDGAVRRAAGSAVEQRALWKRATALSAAIRWDQRARALDILLTVLDRIDPLILEEPTDPLCLDALLASAPPILRQFAEKELESRKHDLPKKARARDQRRAAR